jgi:hypothetical protein
MTPSPLGNDASGAVLWGKRVAAADALYVAAQRYCRQYEAVEDTRDEAHWTTLAEITTPVREAVLAATQEVG